METRWKLPAGEGRFPGSLLPTPSPATDTLLPDKKKLTRPTMLAKIADVLEHGQPDDPPAFTLILGAGASFGIVPTAKEMLGIPDPGSGEHASARQASARRSWPWPACCGVCRRPRPNNRRYDDRRSGRASPSPGRKARQCRGSRLRGCAYTSPRRSCADRSSYATLQLCKVAEVFRRKPTASWRVRGMHRALL